MKIWIIPTIMTALLVSCASPRIDVAPRAGDGGIEFQINQRGVNGLLRMTIWEKVTRQKLWDINLSYYSGQVLKYGEVPKDFKTFNGATNSAKQDYPATGNPPKIPRGKFVYVYVDYQYDTFMTAAASSECYAFRVEKDGSITDLGKQSWPSDDEWPIESENVEQ